MAIRVPTLDLPSVQTRALPDARLGADTRGAFGQEVGQGLEQLGAGLAHASSELEQARDQADAIALTNAETAWQAKKNELFSPKSGLMSAKGEAALPASQQAYEGLKKAGEEIAAKQLVTPRQRQLFQLRLGGQFEDARNQGESYVAQQLEAVRQAAPQAALEQARIDVYNHYADAGAAARQAVKLESVLRATQVSKEEGDARVAMAQGQLWTSRLRAAHDARDVAWLQAVAPQAKEALGDGYTQFAHELEVIKGRVVGDQGAATILSNARQPNGFLDYGKITAAYEALPPGPDKDAIHQALERDKALEREKEVMTKARVFDVGLTALLKRGEKSDIPPSAESWLRENDPEGWLRLTAVAEAEKSRAVNAPPTPAQQAAYTSFLVDANDHPDKYATMAPEVFNWDVLPGLAPRDREQAGRVLAGFHGTANKEGEKLTPLEDRLLLRVGRENNAFPSSRDPGKWTDDDAFNTYYQASQALQQKAADYKSRNGKHAPPDEVERWIRSLFFKGKTPGAGLLGFGGGTTRIQAEMGGKAFEPTFTDEQLANARRALRKNDAPDDADAVDAFLRTKHGFPSRPIGATPLEPVDLEPLAAPELIQPIGGDKRLGEFAP